MSDYAALIRHSRQLHPLTKGQVGEWFAGGGAAGSAVRRRVCKEVKKDYCEDAPHRMAILQAIKFGGAVKAKREIFRFPARRAARQRCQWHSNGLLPCPYPTSLAIPSCA